MESWAIFKHAVRMVFENFGDAIKVTGVLYLAVFAAQLLLVDPIIYDDQAMQAAMMTGTMPWGGFALYMLVAIFASIWAVIGWHRYVLLEERPAIVPKLLPANIFGYFWRTILVTLIVLIPSAIAGGIAGIFAGILAAFTGQSGAALGAAFGAVAGMAIAILIAYRFSPMFPAVALGLKMGFGEAWAKLNGKNGMLVMLAILSAGAAFTLSIPTFFVTPASLAGQAYAFVTGWLQLTVGASIITTLYGVYVEGRALTRS